MGDRTNDRLRREWRELSFFYDYDETSKVWTIVGSRAGLVRLCGLLREFASDPRHDAISEHVHVGPYMYLKFVTWKEPRISADGWYGRLADFRRLADLIEKALLVANAAGTFGVGQEYSAANEARLRFQIASEDFDPAQADPNLSEGK